MSTKTSGSGQAYELEGRYVVWHPFVWDDEPAAPDIRLPLRARADLIADIDQLERPGTVDDQLGKVSAIVHALFPGRADEILALDFLELFDLIGAWKSELQLLTGATLGESPASGVSSASTEAPSSTTSAPASTSASTRSGKGSATAKRSA